MDGGSLPAPCYNLTDPPLPQERNPEYAARLQALLRRLEFSPEDCGGVS
ncbi:MAG: hypothetical protein ABJC61_00095 [Acidobacteriota bacterium]